MRNFVALMMFLALLGYCAMPAVAAMPGFADLSSPTRVLAGETHVHGTNTLADDQSHPGHATKRQSGSLCPDGCGMTHTASCPACLVILPAVDTDGGMLPWRYGMPLRQHPLISADLMPLLPPPRG